MAVFLSIKLIVWSNFLKKTVNMSRFSKVTCLYPLILINNGRLSQAYGCLYMNKIIYFVQYDDHTKMWNTPSEITKCQHKWINANNKEKPPMFKCTIKMTIDCMSLSSHVRVSEWIHTLYSCLNVKELLAWNRTMCFVDV